MKCDAFHRVVCGAVSALTLTLVVTCAVAQTSAISNVDLCNGRDHSSAEPQIRGCSALIKSDADNPKVLAIAYNNRGNAFSKEGQYELAIQDYDKSINLDPGYAKPLNNRGVAYQKQGDLDRAIQDFNAAINIDPNYADAFFNRGATYLKKGDNDTATKDFDAAIRLQPALRAGWGDRCWTRAKTGDLQGALADCNQAIQLEPNVASHL